MSQENVEIVRRIYAAWTQNGSPSGSGLLHPEIEWINPPEAVEGGIKRGVDSFEAASETLNDTFARVRLQFERFVDAGDRVVVIATLQGTGRGSGIEVERRQGYVWTIAEGKAVRMQWFNSPDQALEAVGLSE